MSLFKVMHLVSTPAVASICLEGEGHSVSQTQFLGDFVPGIETLSFIETSSNLSITRTGK